MKSILITGTIGALFCAISNLCLLAGTHPDVSAKLTPYKEDTAAARELARLAHEMRDRHPDSCILLSDECIRLSRKLLYLPGLASALNSRGHAFLNKGMAEKAKPSFTESRLLGDQLQDPTVLSAAYNGLGSCADLSLQLDTAVKYKIKAIEYGLKASDKSFLGLIYNSLGTLYLKQGKLNQSIDNLMKAARYFEELKDTGKMAMTYNNLGIALRNLDKFSDAIPYFKFSLNAARTTGNTRKIINRLNNLGATYTQNRQYHEARMVLEEAMILNGDSSFPSGLQATIRYLGNLFLAEERYDSATYFLEASCRLAEQASDTFNLVATGNDLGEALAKGGNTDKALTTFLRSTRLAAAMNLTPDLMNGFLWLDKIYSQKGDYKKAYDYKTRYQVIRDSIFELDKLTMAEEMKVQFETEKKDREIAILYKDKIIQQSEIQRQRTLKETMLAGTAGIVFFSLFSFLLYKRKRDADLKQQQAAFQLKISELDMKALRAQMNPHFIFNSLRSVNEYIQSHQPDTASEYLIKFSKLMRAILENSRQKEIALSKELDLLVLYMQLESRRMEHPFEYSFEIDPQLDPETILIPSMLLQPVIENSIWHGLAPKDEPGKITIRIKKEKEMIQCEVEDNGIGKTPSPSFNNNDASKSGSFGLKIIEDRLDIIEQLFKIKTHLIFRNLQSNGSMQGHLVSFRIPFENSL